MNQQDWLRYLDTVMVRAAYNSRSSVAVCEDRVRHMDDDDYAALVDQIDDNSILQWLHRTREDRDLVIV